MDREYDGWPFDSRYASMLDTTFQNEDEIDRTIDSLALICNSRPAVYTEYCNTISRLLDTQIPNAFNLRTCILLIIYKPTYMKRLNLYLLLDTNDTSIFNNYSRYVPGPENTNDQDATHVSSLLDLAYSDINNATSYTPTSPPHYQGMRMVNNVNEMLADHTDEIHRPTSHGSVDEAHNLTVKYNGCFLLVRDKVGQAYRFILNSERLVFISFTLGGKEFTELYNPLTHVFFMPPLGWVQDGPYCFYSELRPGTYLRGLSQNNVYIKSYISKFKFILNKDWRLSETVAHAYLKRSFTSISDGIKNSLPNIIITPELLLFLAKHNAHEKYILLLGDICIGEHSKLKPVIRLYKPYKPHKSFIEGLLNYATE